MIFSKQQNGFSLIEAVIYLAIVGILLTAVVSLHLTLGGTNNKLGANIAVSKNRRATLSSIDYLIKNADGILKDVEGDCSDFDATPPELALYFEDDTYLPGTCVENGGGVRISVKDNKVSLTCYPNMSGNGYFQNCETWLYPTSTVYYLSSPDVVVLDNLLAFTTSTATSTGNNFMTVTTNLSVGTQANTELHLRATSTASSTVVLRNEPVSGLVSWLKLDDLSGYLVDEQNNNNYIDCAYGVTTSGLVSSSSAAADLTSTELCYQSSTNSNTLDFNNSFTFTTWLKESSSGAARTILSKQSVTRGYGFYVNNGVPILRVYDSDSLFTASSSQTLTNSVTYHLAVSYDLSNDEVIFYVYQKGVGGLATNTTNGLNKLVNSPAGTNFILFNEGANQIDGYLDEIKIYNRVLTPQEIWALQSQGET